MKEVRKELNSRQKKEKKNRRKKEYKIKIEK